MTARADDNFRQMLRALPVRGATPRDVLITGADVAKANLSRDRRRQGLPPRIRNRTVLDRVVSFARASR